MWYKRHGLPRVWKRFSKRALRNQLIPDSFITTSIKSYEESYTSPASQVIEHFNEIANDFLLNESFDRQLIDIFIKQIKVLFPEMDTREQRLMNEVLFYCRNMLTDIQNNDIVSAYQGMWTIHNILKLMSKVTMRLVTDLESSDIYFNESEDPHPVTGERDDYTYDLDWRNDIYGTDW